MLNAVTAKGVRLQAVHGGDLVAWDGEAAANGDDVDGDDELD